MLLLPSGGDLTASVFILGSTVTLTDTKEMVLEVKTWLVTCIQSLTNIHLGYTNILRVLWEGWFGFGLVLRGLGF